MKSSKAITKLKERASSLKQDISTIYFASKNSHLPFKTKVLIIFTVGYAMSPIDLIPDFIPVLGYLDDLIILPALIALSVKSIPDEIMIDAKEEAKNNPISLKKNWKFAIAFILIWILVLFKIVSLFIK
jgi:uncharacterized membrane protein YkvA (DUF1232 family)